MEYSAQAHETCLNDTQHAMISSEFELKLSFEGIEIQTINGDWLVNFPKLNLQNSKSNFLSKILNLNAQTNFCIRCEIDPCIIMQI